MLLEAVRNPPPVSLRTQKFIAYGYFVLASIFSAFIVFLLIELVFAVLAGTEFNSTNIAVILSSQLFGITLTVYHFEKGYKEKQKLQNYSAELQGIPNDPPIICSRARRVIAIVYFALALISAIAVALHWYELSSSLVLGARLAWTNVAALVASNLLCLALIVFHCLRGMREKPFVTV